MSTSQLLMLSAALASNIPAPTVIVTHPDDILIQPQPKAPLAHWIDAAGRTRVTLQVPGALLRGYSYAGGRPQGPIVIVFGGNANLVEEDDAAVNGFAKSASAVILYDYRGYGFSTGTAHFEPLRADALLIYDATRSQNPSAPIVVLGYSMGTDVALFVALHRMVSGVILAAPWSDFTAILRNGDAKDIFLMTPAATADFNEAAMVKQIHVPLLVFQGTEDELIPPNQGRILERQAASEDKLFVPIAGAKHTGLLENEQAQTAVSKFLLSAAPSR